MKIKLFNMCAVLLTGVISVINISCKKQPPAQAPNLIHKWEIISVYKNDHYGGPFKWVNTSAGDRTAVDFKADGKYYRRENNQNNFRIVGTYTLTGGKFINIVPEDQSSQPYAQEYEIDGEGKLILSTGQTEGVIKEKFKMSH